MKRMLITVAVALAILSGGYGIASASDPPHTDYRLLGNPGYQPQGTCDGTACHSFTKNKFLQDSVSASEANDFSKFCLACHNVVGEAHEKPAGSPSNNVYNNRTGLLPGNSGTSHNWKGSIGNAGTRVPVNTGFSGTTYMPGGKVSCQTCHDGMEKVAEDNIDWASAADSGDHTNFTISWGSPSTKQYLSEYLRVYRYTNAVTRPTESRTKKNYLVSSTEYTYNNATRTITFNQAQSTPVYIYADITEPYYRVDNTANKICVDCHNDRLDSAVSHAPGTGAKDGHPVMVPYGNNNGLHNTLKASADSNILIEGGNVECTSCHDPHNAAGNNGMILRNADASALCTNCHKTNGFAGITGGYVAMHNGPKHASQTVCLECHATHGTNNIMLVSNKVNGVAVNFTNFTGTNGSYANESGTGLCQVCHSATSHYTNDGSGRDHNTGKNCVMCHNHGNGFRPVGNGQCDGCHHYPGGSNDWPAGNSHLIRASGSKLGHMATAGYDPATDTYEAVTADPTRCGRCHRGGTHQNGTVNLNGTGSANCGGGNFTINRNTAGSDVTCSNTKCHTKDSPNWYGGTLSCGACHSIAPQDADSGGCKETTKSHPAHASSDETTCDRCHPSAGTVGSPSNTHQDAQVEVSSTVAAGMSYDTTNSTCASACHKNHDGAVWGGSGNCNMCHYRSGSSIGSYSQMSGLHVTPHKTWGHFSSTIKVNGGSITCANCHPNNDADTTAPRAHIKETDFAKRADMTNAFANVTVTGVGYTKGASIASGSCTKSCHYNPTDPFGEYTICFKPGQKKRFGDYEAARWSDNTLKCNECHSTPSQEATYGSMTSAASKNANTRHANHMFKYKLNPFNYKDGDRNIYCDDCHKTPDTDAVRGFKNHSTLGENGSGVISLPVKSQNAKVSLLFRNNGIGRDGATAPTFATPGGVPTCSNVYCHTIMSTGDWVGQACNTCHGTKDGVDYGSGAPGFTNLTAVGASSYEEYAGGGGAHYSHVMKRGYPCRTCHITGGGDGNPANHHNNSLTVQKENVDVAIDPQWWFHNTTSVYDPTTRSCANVSCHFGSSQNWDCGTGH